MDDTHEELAGRLLIAMPSLVDPNFHHAVVLLGVHSRDEGAFGLVVNRPLDLDMADVLAELGEQPENSDNLPDILGGGPVEPEHGFVLFERSAGAGDEELDLGSNLVVSGNTQTLFQLVSGTIPSRFLLFLGYAGWAPGQLEREIEENSWLVAPLDSDIVFDTPFEKRWEAALKSLGVDPGTIVAGGSTSPS